MHLGSPVPEQSIDPASLGLVDKNQRAGHFILTGSHQPALGEAVSQSLAGRTAVLNLLPFSVKEIKRYGKKFSNWELILQGGYPRLYDKNLKTSRFFNGYIRTYVERDVRQLISIKNIRAFQQLLQLSAGRIGNLINYSSLRDPLIQCHHFFSYTVPRQSNSCAAPGLNP